MLLMQRFGDGPARMGTAMMCIACIGMLLGTLMSSEAGGIDSGAAAAEQEHCLQPRTYHNATLCILSNIYYVKDVDDDAIHLSYRLPFLPGIFYVGDEHGMQEFTLYGGWGGTRVEIHGFEGCFDGEGLYTVLMGTCTMISIIPVRHRA